ncbi:MAG: hypothetical protein ACYDHH_31525 [Solirubrobacteraceae bacterium]
MSYEGVMLLSKENPKLLPLVETAHRIVGEHGNQFSGSAVTSGTLGMPPNQSLRPLSRRGIVEKTGEAKRGHRSYYRLVDPPGVERALRELGALP